MAGENAVLGVVTELKANKREPSVALEVGDFMAAVD